MNADPHTPKDLRPQDDAPHVVEIVIRTYNRRQAEWLIAQITELVERAPATLEVVGSFPADVFDADKVTA